MTRFLRGRPSTEPDRRKPEELETKEPEEVDLANGTDRREEVGQGHLQMNQLNNMISLLIILNYYSLFCLLLSLSIFCFSFDV